MQELASARRRLCAAACLLSLTAVGCTTRGFPNHGGGKRFFQEQALVTQSIDDALAAVDWPQLKDLVKSVTDAPPSLAVQIYCVSHSGGGAQSPASPNLGMGFQVHPAGAHRQLPQDARDPVRAGVQQTAAAGAPTNYMAFAFESADDIRYLMGRVVQQLGEQGIEVAIPTDSTPDTVLCLLVGELGTDHSNFNALIYAERVLTARTRVEAYLLHRVTDPGPTARLRKLGGGAGQFRLRENYFLGFGPLSGGTPERDPFPIPVPGPATATAAARPTEAPPRPPEPVEDAVQPPASSPAPVDPPKAEAPATEAVPPQSATTEEARR
jgi:hypothetical protein